MEEGIDRSSIRGSGFVAAVVKTAVGPGWVNTRGQSISTSRTAQTAVAKHYGIATRA